MSEKWGRKKIFSLFHLMDSVVVSAAKTDQTGKWQTGKSETSRWSILIFLSAIFLSAIFLSAIFLSAIFLSAIFLSAIFLSASAQKFIQIQDRACGHNPRGEGGLTDAFRFSCAGRLEQRIRLLRRDLKCLLRLFLQRDEGRGLALSQRTDQRQPQPTLGACISSLSLLDHSTGQSSCGFQINWIVQRDQRLKRRVGADAANLTDLSAAAVEGHHGRVRRRALAVCIETATEPVFALGVHPGLSAVSRTPQAGGVRWHHGRAAHFRREQTADGERLIAHSFGAEPEPGAARLDQVARIGLAQSGRDLRSLAISVAHHNSLDEILQRPTVIAILNGEPVQQIRVRGRGAERAKILFSLDDTDAEKPRPHAVGPHARRERVVAAEEPLREAETVERRPVRKLVEGGGHARRDRIALIEKISADVNLRFALFLRRQFTHQRQPHNVFVEIFLRLVSAREFVAQLADLLRVSPRTQGCWIGVTGRKTKSTEREDFAGLLREGHAQLRAHAQAKRVGEVE